MNNTYDRENETATWRDEADWKKKQLWDVPLIQANMPRVKFDSVMQSDEGLSEWLENIVRCPTKQHYR